MELRVPAIDTPIVVSDFEEITTIPILQENNELLDDLRE